MYEVPAAKNSADDFLTGQTLAKIESGTDTIKSLQDKKVPGATWLEKSNNQISDEFSRVNEDPMFAIKKQEIQTKKKTLSNPLQLKRVREKLLEKGCIEKAKLIDALLKKAAGSIASNKYSNKEEKEENKKHHSHHHKNKKESSDSDSESDDNKHSKRHKHHHKHHRHHHYHSRSTSSDSSRSKSKSRSRSRDRKERDISIPKKYKRETGISKTLTKEEREAKIAEMLRDGKINEDLRWNRLIKHEEKEKDEESESLKNPSFLRDINKQAFSVSEDNDGSIAERIQRRKNYVMDMKEEP